MSLFDSITDTIGGLFKTPTSSMDKLKHPTKEIGDRVFRDVAQQPFESAPASAMWAPAQETSQSYLENLLSQLGGPAPKLSEGYQEYISPYIQSNLDPTLRGIRDATAHAQNQWDAMSNLAGAGPGSFDARWGIYRNDLAERGIQAESDATSEAYYKAFDDAMRRAGIDINNLQQQQQQGTQTANALFGTGAQEAKAQMLEFLREQGWTTEQMTAAAGIIDRLQNGEETPPGDSEGMEWLKLAANAAGIFL